MDPPRCDHTHNHVGMSGLYDAFSPIVHRGSKVGILPLAEEPLCVPHGAKQVLVGGRSVPPE